MPISQKGRMNQKEVVNMQFRDYKAATIAS